MDPSDSRSLELISRIEAALAELRDHLARAAAPAKSDEHLQDQQAIRAFADETFRARDA